MILKSLVIVFLFVFSISTNLNASVASDLKKFKKELKKKNYIDAMDIYSKNINGLETEKFQSLIYKKIISLIKKDHDEAKILIDNYLSIEYDNAFGLFLLSKVYNVQKEYMQSIEVLYKLRTHYLDEKFKNNIENTLDTVVNSYLNTLQKEKKLDDIYYFIELTNQNNDELSMTKSYSALLRIHQDEVNKNNILDALTILYKIKTYYIEEELLNKINRYLNTVISEYIKKLIESKDTIHLDLLESFLISNNDSENSEKLRALVESQSKHKYEIPLQTYGVHYLVDISINGTNVKLLLDTGASTSAINNSTIQNIDYKVLRYNIKIYTGNGITYSKLISVDTFELENIFIKNFNFTILMQDIPMYDGLLGMNFFRNYKFFIDQEKNILYLD
ncbi:MAG TPA: hypothetical protein EYG73_09235 [Arcobacter sp.]|nr:hypothetical protein [Arcobacter sp.]